jgi:hypothetical protein
METPFVARQTELTARLRAEAAWLWSTRRAVLAGRSAAALHGAKWIDPKAPAELLHDNRHAPPAIRVWADAIADEEIAAVDALLRATRCTRAEVESIAARSNGRRGIRRARAVLELVDAGAQSSRTSTWAGRTRGSGSNTRVRTIDSAANNSPTTSASTNGWGKPGGESCASRPWTPLQRSSTV